MILRRSSILVPGAIVAAATVALFLARELRPPNESGAPPVASPDAPGEPAVLSAGFVPVPPDTLAAYAARGYVAAPLRRRDAASDGMDVAITDRSQKLLAALEVRNSGRDELYVSVLSLADDGSRNRIHPRGGPERGRLDPGASEVVLVQVVAGRGWPTGRAMRDRYVVLGTPEPKEIELDVTRSGSPAFDAGRWLVDSPEPPADAAACVVDLWVTEPVGTER